MEGAADEWAAHLKETERALHFMRDADTRRCANVRSLSDRIPKPKRSAGTEVNSIQLTVYFQCSREPPRSPREVYESVSIAELFHQVDSFEWLDGTQQYSCADSWLFSRHVEHVRRPIDEVHISEPSAQEQGSISSRSSAIRMATPIARWVRLCLDDTAAKRVSTDFAHDGLPNQILGQLRRVGWQAGP